MNPEPAHELKYIGVVQICSDLDLHAFMLKPFRRTGLVRKVLKNTVLPYIFDQLGQSNIIVTSHSEEGKKLVKSVGFRPLDEEVFCWMLER